MHVVRLALTTSKGQADVILQRFYVMGIIHNTIVKKAKHMLRRIQFDKYYQGCLKELNRLSKLEERSPKDEEALKQAKLFLNSYRESIGLTKDGLEKYGKVIRHKYRKYVSSDQMQKEAFRIWKGVDDVLFHKGKEIHYKKHMDITTICEKKSDTGIIFKPDTFTVEWNGLSLKCRLPKRKSSRDYVMHSLNGDISYCEIQRQMFPNGWHFYVNIYVRSDVPSKIDVNKSTEKAMGIDPGVSTVAAVSDTKAVLQELAPKCKEYNKKIASILRHMELSKRATNPNKYNPDGTVKKGEKSKWIFSNKYLKNRRLLRYLYRKKSAYTKDSHRALCNELIKDANVFITEKMDFAALAKRSKKTEKSDKTVEIKQKDGSVKAVQKYKKKKRFGKSINDRSPSLFLSTLKSKCKQYGLKYIEVNTVKFRASQYNHATNKYVKCPLKQRFKNIAEHNVQRDLYSAFLLKNSNKRHTAANRQNCKDTFGNFIVMHDELIDKMKSDGISMKQCFGF